MNIDQLNRTYGIRGQLKFIEGKGEFPFILISNRSATALISLYAGQVLSFQPVDEDEDLLFLSQKSFYDEGKSIRGGIPVCWPWFGDAPSNVQGPIHGFVRKRLWKFLEAEAVTDSETRIKLGLIRSDNSETWWPQAFALELVISVGDSLTLELITRNTGNKAFSITEALHTYFLVGNIKQVKVLGLEDTPYLDKLDRFLQKTQVGPVTILEEVDRIYTDVKDELVIDDPAFDRMIRISSSSGKTAVVWNPWIDTSLETNDLEHNDYKRFLCVETGNVAHHAIQVPPGGESSLLAEFQIIRD